jgi:hypothetical protein
MVAVKITAAWDVLPDISGTTSLHHHSRMQHQYIYQKNMASHFSNLHAFINKHAHYTLCDLLWKLGDIRVTWNMMLLNTLLHVHLNTNFSYWLEILTRLCTRHVGVSFTQLKLSMK